MKILKHGKVFRDPNAKFTTDCPICGCQFEYADDEVKFDTLHYILNDHTDYTEFVICPECRRYVFVNDRWRNKNQNERNYDKL